MQATTVSALRSNLAKTLDAVIENREEVVVPRGDSEGVVIVALDEYESLKETAYLMRSPENARRLVSSIERIERGEAKEHDLSEFGL